MKQEKITKLMLKLIKLTKQNEIEWESETLDNNELQNGEFVIGKVYEVNIKDNSFRIFRYKYKYWRDEYDFEWSQSIRMELLDEEGETDYEFEYKNAMNDLYDIVREQCSQIGFVIDEILETKFRILKASYGTNKKSIDVTSRLQDRIKSEKLTMIASNDIAGDPDYGTLKKLKIKYEFNGETFEKEFKEGLTVNLPE